MLGIIIGTVSLFALIATLRRGRCRGAGRSFKRLSTRLGASPSQEDALRAVADELYATGRATREDGLAVTSALAGVLEKDSLDDTSLEDALARFDAAAQRVRGTIIASMRSVHGTLDASQRKRLIAMFSRRGFGRRPFAHA